MLPTMQSLNELRDIPRHVAIIMDGNGRYAKARGQVRWEGHSAGAKSVREAVETARSLGIEYLTLYAFSVNNWSRPRLEVEALMRLLTHFARREQADLIRQGIRVKVAGRIGDLPASVRRAVEGLMEATSAGTQMTLTLAISYGARADILEAARSLALDVARGLIAPSSIDESALRKRMWTADLPDVDLLIRTGGESRISDFLLFESAYAELEFLPIMWPEFKRADFERCLNRYRNVERRFGLTGDQVRSENAALSVG